MKYKVCKPNVDCPDFWTVRTMQNNAIISKHEDASEANSAAQRYIEDDNWHAANRD